MTKSKESLVDIKLLKLLGISVVSTTEVSDKCFIFTQNGIKAIKIENRRNKKQTK